MKKRLARAVVCCLLVTLLSGCPGASVYSEPTVLDCSSAWDALHEAASAFLQSGVADARLAQSLAWAQARLQAPGALASGIQAFHWALQAQSADEAQDVVGDFCLYGHVAARVIESLVSSSGQARKDDIFTAFNLLGFRQSLDWLECSRWGSLIDSYDLRMALFGDGSACHSPDEARDASSYDADALRELWWAYLIAPSPAEALPPTTAPNEAEVSVVTVGDHAALPVELENTLSTLFPESVFRYLHVGHFHYCQLLPRCDDPIAVFLQAASPVIEKGTECEELGLCSFGEFASALAPLWREALSARRADLVVCTRWWVLGAALREEALPVGLGAEVVVHMLFGGPCLLTPIAWHGPAIARFRALASGAGPDIAYSVSPIYAEVFRQLGGVAVPVVPPVALHLQGWHRWERSDPYTAYVARTQYTASLQGLAFAHVLRQCLNAAPPEVRRWQVMVAGWAQAEHRLSFEQIAKFSTAVFIPVQRQQMMLTDLYSMHIPLFVPDGRLYSRMLVAELDGDAHPRWSGLAERLSNGTSAAPGIGWRLLGRMPRSLHDLRLGFFPADRLFLSEPNTDTPWRMLDWNCDAPTKIHAWFEFWDGAHFPHVQHFHSVPHLLATMAAADLQRLSQGMRDFHTELRVRSRTFWSAVLRHVRTPGFARSRGRRRTSS